MSAQPTGRIEALDMTKGVLVVLMVVYHSLNYSSRYYLGFRLLPFLPPSFIFIVGFLISLLYPSVDGPEHRRPAGRLAARGARLLAIFTLLNLAVNLAGRHRPNGEKLGLGYFVDHATEIYVFGSGRFAAFQVLLPIAYILLAAPVLLWAGRRPVALPLIALAVIGLCVTAERAGIPNANLNLMSAGLLGMLAGRRPMSGFTGLARHWALTGLAGVGSYVVGLRFGEVYGVQLAGAAFALAAIYALADRFGRTDWPRRRLIRLGQYSLIAYIVQIGILQVISSPLGRPAPLSLEYDLMFFTTLGLMTGVVELIHWVRSRSPGAERIYRIALA
jgi:hypothetical protein